MSTRYLRKAYGNDKLATGENVADEIDESPLVESKLFNVFDALNSESEEEKVKSAEAEDDDDVDDSKRKKKKKKKKRKNAAEKTVECVKDDSTDEIERSVREVNALLGEPEPSCSSKNSAEDVPAEKSKESIIGITHKQLNSYNELRRIYGSKSIQAEQSKRRTRGRVGYTKKTWLVVPRDIWPPLGKSGLSMSIDHSMKSEGDITYFVFVHSSSYRETQNKFFEAVESQNPENIINMLHDHPYHVDTLIQLSDLCKLNEDLQTSAELIERAVYCLESALDISFNLTTGKCRLSYKKQTNRAFYITLFKHMMFVGGRACYRTSLEFCKLIMSLDPENDPLAIVLAIDLYALRAREYQWFIDFCQLWEESRNLSQLPNIAFSLALANFWAGNVEVANELLENALFMFPGILLPLLDKCGIQADLKVIGHDYFNGSNTKCSASLEKLQLLYITRSYYLWQDEQVLHWLEKASHSVLGRVDAGDEYAKFCRTKRAKRFQGQPPRNILRHIILTDFKEVTISHHSMRDTGPIFSYDPLPPADSCDIYQRSTTVPRPTQASSNIFSLFMSSLYTDLEGNIPNIALNGFAHHDDDESDEEID